MMQDGDDVSRRSFLGQLGAGAFLGAAGVSSKGSTPEAAWTPPPVLTDPNILIIMVDQMRLPVWLSSSQRKMLSQAVLPNIMGRIQNHSYNFGQFFVAATNCTPSRACLLTGLYTPQTAMYCSENNSASLTGPALNPAFPTWATAASVLNPAYRGNFWWFGKWHLSKTLVPDALAAYGFNTRIYPGGRTPPYNPSPNGAPNEGTDGGPDLGLVYANDAMITADFLSWLNGKPPTPGPPSTPWCATVSLINPHDISSAPVWLESPYPPVGYPIPTIHFPPPAGMPPPLYTTQPSPWNYEDLQQVTNKPGLQYSFQNSVNRSNGAVTDWVLFLNQYFWLQTFVDQQVGRILHALHSSPFAGNTIIIFLSDHGDYAGSHGLHGKGSAVYDESLRVPFYVQFPGQTGAIPMNQMCSAVDLFGLICDLATQGSGAWKQAYPDQANRQSMWSFLYNNSSETRVAPAPVGLPYIFHTYDEVPQASGPPSNHPPKTHIVCLRTKQDENAGAIGAKLAFYSAWGLCTTYPNATPPDPEFYDYNPATTNNSAELGNDYYNPASQNTIAQYKQVMGGFGPPATGLIGSELNRPLVGVGTDGNPLAQAQAAAQQTFFDFIYGTGVCGE